MNDKLNFRISAALKDIIGRDLITDEYIAVFRHATLTGINEKMKAVIDQVLYKEMMTIERHNKS